MATVDFRNAAGVVIGVGHYRHVGLTDLPFAPADAKAMAHVLRRADLCRFRHDNVALVTNRDARRATLIERLYDWLPAHAAGAELAVVYFAGHGMVDENAENPEGFLLPHDADPDDLAATAISMTELSRCIDAIDVPSMVLFLDCCHSGKILVRDGASDVRSRRVGPSALGRLQGMGRYILTSCDEGQVALETNELEHGLFTHHLLEGLCGVADRDKDGRVGVAELFEHVSTAVERDAKQRAVDQRPWYNAVGTGGVFLSAPGPTATMPGAGPRPSSDPLRDIEQTLFENDAAGIVSNLQQLEARESLEAVPYALHCLAHGSEAVQAAGQDLIRSLPWRQVVSTVEQVARRGVPRDVGYVLDGLQAYSAHKQTVQLLERLVPLLHGDSRNRAIFILGRKRVSLGRERITQAFRDIKSDFEIQGNLGEGLFTATYRAKSLSSGLDVVVRTLRHEFVHQIAIKDSFIKLARMAWKLNHQNLGRTLDVRSDEDEKLYFVVRDFIPGRSLQKILEKDTRLSQKRVVAILSDVVQALGVVHAAQLFHGGVKPTNVFVHEDGRAVLGDLSIPVTTVPVAPDLLCYDYRYVSPEMLTSTSVGPRSDFYSLGCVAYELLSGSPPFVAEHDRHHELTVQHLYEDVQPVSERGDGISPRWDGLLARMVARDVGNRFATFRELVAALRDLEAELEQETQANLVSTGMSTSYEMSRYEENESIIGFSTMWPGSSTPDVRVPKRAIPTGESTIPSRAEALPGGAALPAGARKKIGKYEILSVIGKGAMGIVYKARDPVIERLVAIKTLSSDLLVEPELRERFYREAMSAGKLSHPNIVTIFDLGEDAGAPFIVMELLEGSDLRRLVNERKRVTLERTLRWMRETCSGLAHAHKLGIIHRDIKPANILVDSQDSVKIMDFGIARLGSSVTTQTGVVMGTPSYMSPEQIRGDKVDERADLYAWGSTFYEVLTGKRAFHADSVQAIFFRILNDEPEAVDVLNPLIPRDVAETIERATKRDASQRWASASELEARLRELESELSERKRTLRAELSRRLKTFERELSKYLRILGDAGIAKAVAGAPTGDVPVLDAELDYFGLVTLARTVAPETDRLHETVAFLERREVDLSKTGALADWDWPLQFLARLRDAGTSH